MHCNSTMDYVWKSILMSFSLKLFQTLLYDLRAGWILFQICLYLIIIIKMIVLQCNVQCLSSNYNFIYGTHCWIFAIKLLLRRFYINLWTPMCAYVNVCTLLYCAVMNFLVSLLKWTGYKCRTATLIMCESVRKAINGTLLSKHIFDSWAVQSDNNRKLQQVICYHWNHHFIYVKLYKSMSIISHEHMKKKSSSTSTKYENQFKRNIENNNLFLSKKL